MNGHMIGRWDSPLCEVPEEPIEDDLAIGSASSSTSPSVSSQTSRTLNGSFRRNLTLNSVNLPPPPKLGVSSLERAIAISLEKVHHGLVLLSDGKGQPRPARLELTQDTLAVQVPVGYAGAVHTEETGVERGVRNVMVKRQRDGGLGLSIKGGTDHSCKVPVLISKIYKDQSADQTGQLFVGDAIIEVNGVNVESCNHEDVVKILRDAGEEVQLTVRHYRNMAAFLNAGSLRRGLDGVSLERGNTSGNSINGTLRSNRSTGSEASQGGTNGAPKGWRTYVTIQLPMAYVTRYLWGTDKLRSNAFEVRAVDGTSSDVIHCEDSKVLSDWVRYISDNIVNLNNKSIKMSNKYLHPNDLIVYLGWVAERIEQCAEVWQNWDPKFLILKGSDVCFFDSPPLCAADLSKCSNAYKIYETSFKILKDAERLDGRDNCFVVDTSVGTRHYLSFESRDHLLQLEGAWQRATYYAVQRLGKKTFACNYENRPSALTVDFSQGFSLYDIHNKVFIWRYRFSQLKSSSDDGRMRIRLVFDTGSLPGSRTRPENRNVPQYHRVGDHSLSATESIKDIDCILLFELLYTIHSFMVAKLVSTDPDFLKSH